MNISELLRASASRYPKKNALAYGSNIVEGFVTYATLESEVERIAKGLASLGIKPGDRVGIALGNTPHFAEAYFGVLRAGAVVVPLNIMLTATELGRILSDSGARVVLSEPPFLQTVEEAADGAATVEHVVSMAKPKDLGGKGPEVSVERTTDDLAVLAYTSGTTGEPKGAMLTHGNLLANLEQQMAIPEAHVAESDVLLLALPLFHIFGLNVTLGLTIMNGATGVLIERFEPIATLRMIQEHKATVIFGAPPMYKAWLDTPGADQYDLSSVRLAISGAAPLSAEVLNGFKNEFGVEIYEGYGLTETSPTLTSNRMTDTPRPLSVGKPLPNVEMRLINEEGEDVELGDPGEIIVRGPNVFKGYWNRKEQTDTAFVGDWFRTGDIAVRDEEGYIYLVDRKRDLIIVSGFNVFPSEIETTLLTHPKVKDAAAVGVPHTYTGEAVKAYVVTEDGVEATTDELLDYLRLHLARFKCPESIEFVDQLPHLLTGKVLRRALRTSASQAGQV